MWTEHINNIRLFNYGKYNKVNLDRYDLPVEDPDGLNAVYVPQNKGTGVNTPYQKESFDPSLVGLPNQLIPQDQKFMSILSLTPLTNLLLTINPFQLLTTL